MYNTPNTFGVYIIGLVAKYLESLGGLDEMYKRNKTKAEILYNCIDDSDGYFVGSVKNKDHQIVNECYISTLPSEELEKKIIAEAAEAGFSGLKGHRSVGGLRASIYNAFPQKGVEALVDFMKKFKAK
jgi:phosphoserine aminotransferase